MRHRSQIPGDSAAVTFLSPDRWRSRFQPLISGHVNSPSQKGHDRRIARNAGKSSTHGAFGKPWGPNSQCPVVGDKLDKLINTIVGFYIPIVRIPVIKGGIFPIPKKGSWSTLAHVVNCAMYFSGSKFMERFNARPFSVTRRAIPSKGRYGWTTICDHVMWHHRLRDEDGHDGFFLAWEPTVSNSFSTVFKRFYMIYLCFLLFPFFSIAGFCWIWCAPVLQIKFYTSNDWYVFFSTWECSSPAQDFGTTTTVCFLMCISCGKIMSSNVGPKRMKYHQGNPSCPPQSYPHQK